MKRKILSPLLSALVIPGLGQAMNSSLLKAAVLLALVMLLASGGIISLYVSLKKAAYALGNHGSFFSNLNDLFSEADMTIPALFLAALALLWLYSVVDAFVEGMRLDAQDEILPDR
jgi:hypothetical protein